MFPPKPLVVFTISALLGAFTGLVIFRIVLSFTPIGEQLQGTFTEACRWGGPEMLFKFYAAGALAKGRILDGGPEGPTGYPPDPPLHQAANFGNAET